jgi:hypothetical protein
VTEKVTMRGRQRERLRETKARRFVKTPTPVVVRKNVGVSVLRLDALCFAGLVRPQRQTNTDTHTHTHRDRDRETERDREREAHTCGRKEERWCICSSP